MTEEDEEFQRIEREAAMKKRKYDDDDIQDYVRPWVGLTDEEWLSLGCKSVEEVRIGLAIQAKLKEKNT
jgi:hypothetical protein